MLNRESALYDRQLANAKATKVKRFITFGVHQDADMKATVCTLSAESSDVIVIFETRGFISCKPARHAYCRRLPGCTGRRPCRRW